LVQTRNPHGRPPSSLQPEVAGRIDDGDHAHNAPITFDPTPRKCGNGHTLTGYLVDIPTNVFEACDAISEQEAMARLPFRKYFLDRFTGLAFKFCIDIRQKRTAGAVRTNRSC